PDQGIAHIVRHVGVLRETLAEFRLFKRQLADDAVAAIAADQLLARLAGKDVLFVFIESYGRSALADPQYAGLIGPRLDAMAGELAAAGFAARSGWLTAPTVGGGSWLAHGTLLSG